MSAPVNDRLMTDSAGQIRDYGLSEANAAGFGPMAHNVSHPDSSMTQSDGWRFHWENSHAEMV